MRKNRIGYLLWMVLMAGLLFFFGWWFFLAVLAGQILLAAAMGILVLRDAKKVHIKAEWKIGGREGQQIPLILLLHTDQPLLGSGSVHLNMEIEYRMFGEILKKSLILPIQGKQTTYRLPVEAAYCGEVCVRCCDVRVCDLLKLFRVKVKAFEEVRTIIYPRRVDLDVELASTTIGLPEHEGMLQNRKGNDPSEIYDIREYMPGDDVRTIHWKLSSKTMDSLIIREASDPSHYHTAILPDLGLYQGEKAVTLAELSRAAAVGAAVCEKLMETGTSVCMILWTERGLEAREISCRHDWEQAMVQWLSTRIQKESGSMLQYFQMEHLEQYFTRLLILTAGKYSQSIQKLDGRIGISIIDVIEGAHFTHTTFGGSCEITEAPAEWEENEHYRIFC